MRNHNIYLIFTSEDEKRIMAESIPEIMKDTDRESRNPTNPKQDK